jgi:hypothetical protein
MSCRWHFCNNSSAFEITVWFIIVLAVIGPIPGTANNFLLFAKKTFSGAPQ